jgi:hypothetical protein
MESEEVEEVEEVETVTLYRPVGQEEMELISAEGYDWFPLRLPDQPIFYPVCNEEYACEIASKWNTKDGKPGFVLKFKIKKEFIDNYETHIVGSKIHEEYWIPAEDLVSFNEAIVGFIEVIKIFDASQEKKTEK